MADESLVLSAKLELPEDADSFGLTTEAIGSLFDSGLSRTKVMLTAWRVIAAKASTIEDVSESGSSRTSKLSENAQQQILYWQSISDKEDKELITGPTGRTRFASHTAKRV